MVQCPYCLEEVDDDGDGDTILHCDCGANFWRSQGLFAPDADGIDIDDDDDDDED